MTMMMTEAPPEHSARSADFDQEVLLLPLSQLRPSKLNPRREFDDAQMQKLRDAIRFEGILSALTVRRRGPEDYEIVAGERRYRAARDLGLHEVPVVVREVTDRQLVEMALSENMNREELTPVDEAHAFAALVGMGPTQAEIAERVRKDVSYVSNTLRLLRLPTLFQGLIVSGELSRAHGIALCGLAVADIGLNKAVVLVHRLNLWYGLEWKAIPGVFDGQHEGSVMTQVLITCVDSARARREIHRGIGTGAWEAHYWLDIGNRQEDGQVVLGQPLSHLRPLLPVEVGDEGSGNRRRAVGLPTVMDLFPELLDEDLKEDEAPSCSLAEALGRQDLFVNDHMSRWALHLLWTLFRKGAIEHHGYLINLADGIVNPIPVPEGAP